MKTTVYTIRAITNMQPGSGEATQGVVDNFVQRDPATNYPVIFGSSVKGAIRSFMDGNQCQGINQIFGDNDKQGSYRFFSAQLIAIPLRSNKKPYYLAVSPGIAKQILEIFDTLCFKPDDKLREELKCLKNLNNFNNPLVEHNINNLVIEDFEHFGGLNDCDLTELKKLLHADNNIVVLPDDKFNEIVNNENLPVIARNHLENGQSKNLWYEQVIPRFSVFIMPLMYPENDQYFTSFDSKLTSNIVQIGGNATVGYGYTKFEKIPAKQNNESQSDNC